jgi:hypothetical protein
MRIKTIILSAVLVAVSSVTGYAITVSTGFTKADDERYSLRMLHHYKRSNVKISLAPTTRSTWLFGGSTTAPSHGAATEQGFLKLENGNTAIVLKFQYKVKATAQPRIKAGFGL